MVEICYLCSSPILCKPSGDHVVPKGLIERKQPKAKGFDYGGMIPTHIECNNRFGPETYASKALQLLAVWDDPDIFFKLEHPLDPTIKLMGVNSERLSMLLEEDLRFFKIIDARGASNADLRSTDYYKS